MKFPPNAHQKVKSLLSAARIGEYSKADKWKV